jgi:hypothetical protein
MSDWDLLGQPEPNFALDQSGLKKYRHRWVAYLNPAYVLH